MSAESGNESRAQDGEQFEQVAPERGKWSARTV